MFQHKYGFTSKTFLLLILSFMERSGCENLTTVKYGIQDIHVDPILHAKNHGNLVQLKIRWTSNVPINNVKYDVIIRSISNKTENYFCKSSICAEYGVTKTELILPEAPEFKEHGECLLYLGCDYNILVETINKEFNSSVNYSVADCVNKICSCYYERYLPVVNKLTAEFDKLGNRLFISYKAQNLIKTGVPLVLRNMNLTSIRFRLEKPLQSHLSWGGRSEHLYEFVQPIRFNHVGLAVEKIILLLNNSLLEPGHNYTLRASLIDERNCEGRFKDVSIHLPARQIDVPLPDHSSSVMWIIIVILSFSISIILLLIVTVLCIKRYRKSMKIVTKWRGVYNSVPSVSTSINVPMLENALYIEKEILEAKARGELDILEIPQSALKIGREIGKGAFGRVFCANAFGIPGKPSPITVAVKQLKRRPTAEELEEFLGEIATMKKVGKHPNIVALLGFCTIKQPLMMIMEYIGCGDLLGYLRKVREKRSQYLIMTQQTNENLKTFGSGGSSISGNKSIRGSTSSHSLNNASGSANVRNNSHQACKYADLFYLSSSSDTSSYINQPDTTTANIGCTETLSTMVTGEPEEKSMLYNYSKSQHNIEYVIDHNELENFAIQIARGMQHLERYQITHRDLAARNILIDEKKTLKISDFGLSRSGIYVNTKNKRVPLRWLSIEAIKDNLYSSKSDVWAFGIVLWEIGTLGGFPYPTLCNTEVLEFLLSDKRLDRPENCTKQLYNLMLECWSANPNDRPTFQEILEKLDPNKQPIYIDFNELDPNYAFPPTIDEVGIIYRNRTTNNSLSPSTPIPSIKEDIIS